jgi:predicted PurR-regulated permease PerM
VSGPFIEHDPNERRQSNFIWWLLWIFVALLWAWYLYFFEFDWPPIALGGVTMATLVSWAVDLTGNRVPRSWGR